MPDTVQQTVEDGTDQMIEEVRRDKYMLPAEERWSDTLRRFANGVFGGEPDRADHLFDLLERAVVSPAGRPLAAIGSGRNVTAVNCFVLNEIEDSMRSEAGIGIMDTLARSAYTMQMGGGIGLCFSTIRPKDAMVSRIAADASGPLSFMDMWDSMCRTIMSAGYRRGAMMATLHCDHPDVLDFVDAKADGRRLRMFNLSVLITDAFMEAVRHDRKWALGHAKPPRTGAGAPQSGRDGAPWYVWRTVRARDLWDRIMRRTYVHAEPGVIFIDRVNALSNLSYCESVTASNPCAEQMLPPNGDCNLGHVNLAACVKNAFTDRAHWDMDLVADAVKTMVRVLDNVVDLSAYPLEEQRAEALAKRRIGLGVTGLGNALQFLRLRYGSAGAVVETSRIMKFIANTAYRESVQLASERGAFPMFDRKKFCASPFVGKLDPTLRTAIADVGVRNGMVLSVAPTGTNSIAQCGNCSGGVEPPFDHYYDRKVLQGDGSTFKVYRVKDFGYREWCRIFGEAAPLPSYMVKATELTPEDHVRMLAAAQEWVDNSISKTINCPTEMSFEEFRGVYDMAYDLGCKCCATHRPDPESGRGSVLSSAAVDSSAGAGNPGAATAPRPAVLVSPPIVERRPEELSGRTYKIRWPHLEEALYLTVNDVDTPEGVRPFEMFLSTKAVRHIEWMTIFTRLVSAVFRRGGDVTFLLDEMRQVQSADGGARLGKHHFPSLVALIGSKLGEHFTRIGLIAPEASASPTLEFCPRCNERQFLKAEGCGTCLSCHYSNCG